MGGGGGVVVVVEVCSVLLRDEFRMPLSAGI